MDKSLEQSFIVKNCYNTGSISSRGGIVDYIVTNVDNYLDNNYWHEDCGALYGLMGIQSNNNAQPKSEQEFNTLAEELGEEYINDIQVIRKNEETGEEEKVWKYNNGYPILKWQIEEN